MILNSNITTMYIILLTYVKPLEDVDRHLTDHVAFLNDQYASKKFFLSGRKNPRTGGVILAHNCDREELNRIISQDPFHANEIAKYEIIEFEPSKYDEALESFINQ